MNPDLYQELVRQINSLQKQIDALVKPEVGRWQTWTPTLTQGVAVTFNTNFARYKLDHNGIMLEAELVCTSAGTGGQAIVIGGIPTFTNWNAGSSVKGIVAIIDAGTAVYVGAPLAQTANSVAAIAHNASNYIGAVPSFALAAGDVVCINLGYEQ